ncbi:hypothetical protein RHSIM_RhsimUnG0069300 [Rhododendron simsii]|uniref:Glycosyl transferase CAP10 domain-containing protein n=1 Tax=Rhododendron simsii TaxID=118357 RepID=A0A834L5A2_RHOSS|nr:hypothetical protein RHSIM_RhsimUnG0069300 [Rhododendron simsii]
MLAPDMYIDLQLGKSSYFFTHSLLLGSKILVPSLQAQEIGKAGSDFTQEDLKMDYVYNYMFHLLSEYAKLMRYKPTIPERAIEICSETLACPAIEIQKKFMMESMVKGPTDVSPCDMPPPYDALALRTLLKRKANSISQVELWEKRYWENQTKHN